MNAIDGQRGLSDVRRQDHFASTGRSRVEDFNLERRELEPGHFEERIIDIPACLQVE